MHSNSNISNNTPINSNKEILNFKNLEKQDESKLNSHSKNLSNNNILNSNKYDSKNNSLNNLIIIKNKEKILELNENNNNLLYSEKNFFKNPEKIEITDYNRLGKQQSHSNYEIAKIQRLYSADLDKKKSRSNPSLKYVTIEVKSIEKGNVLDSINKQNPSKDRLSSSRRNDKNLLKNIQTKSFNIRNNTTYFEKGLFVIKDHSKGIIFITVLISFGAIIFTFFFNKNKNLFEEIENFLKNILVEKIWNFNDSSLLKGNSDKILIAFGLLFLTFLFLYLLYRINQIQEYENVALEDYNNIRESLIHSKDKEENSLIIGLFENNFVMDNSIKHNIKEKNYKKYVLPMMNNLRTEENVIQEAEILIMDQAHKVWRLNLD